MAIDTFRIKLPIQELVEQILDQLPDHVWRSATTTFLDPAMAGGQFILAIERRLKAAGHSDENIAQRVWGCEERLIRVKYVQNWHKALSAHLYVRDALNYDWGDMKFDVIVGNPPFSKVSEGKTAGKRSEELYIQFYKWCVEHGNIVAMVMPTTDKKLQKTHNTLLRDTANVIKHIDAQQFPEICMPMWYVIADKQNTVRAQIEWHLDGSLNNDIPWVKGYINMTAHKNLVGAHLGHDKPKKKSDVLIYHKVNVTHGLVTLWCDEKYINTRGLFPKKGWAVLMPQTFNDDGWSQTEVVKCTGKQAAFNGMNIVFVDNQTQGEKLVEFMKTDHFIQAANKVKQGFNNMNLTGLKAMKLDKTFKDIIT
jgi:hypothetical protein